MHDKSIVASSLFCNNKLMKKSGHSKKPFIISLIVVAVLVLGIVLYAIFSKTPEPPGLPPPDPGEAGKATLEGIDSDSDGVRDDVQRYIAITVPESARHREALRDMARVIQWELLAQTKEEAINIANEGVRSIECLSYLGVRNQDRWEEVMALMLNTQSRLLAMDAHADRISSQVFKGIPYSQKRLACKFDVEALPN